jgi:hypothetical protein
MQTLITEFISLDGVVQAPGGPKEDTDGGFRHGGWSMKYFDPEVMGATYDELSKQSDALLQGRWTLWVPKTRSGRREGCIYPVPASLAWALGTESRESPWSSGIGSSVWSALSCQEK